MPARADATPEGCADPADGRFVVLAGSLNTRDLGGLPLAGGGRTRFGAVLRSDALLTLAADDAARLSQLRLDTVIDLRQPYERERDLSALADDDHVRVHHIELWQPIFEAGRLPDDPWDLTALYIAALDHCAAAFAAATRLLAEACGAALFHCTAGKDRTGMLAALLLEAVGVPRAAVIEDYALTHERIGPLRERLLADAEARGIARTDFARLLGAEPGILMPALEHLDARYGGALAYLHGSGVEDATIARLRERLVGDDAPTPDVAPAERSAPNEQRPEA
jgi:protein-tyrosine phosphatase